MPISVEEVRKLIPEAEVYCLTSEASYLIVCDLNEVNSATMRSLTQSFRDLGVYAAIVGTLSPNAISVFRMEKADASSR